MSNNQSLSSNYVIHDNQLSSKTESFVSIDPNRAILGSLNSNLQVYVLSNNVDRLNQSYIRMFSSNEIPGFADTIFSGIQYPDTSWIKRFTGFMNRSEAIELYNHYLIWLQSLELAQPIVVIYDRSYPAQPNEVILELLKAGQYIRSYDILFFGKYLDRCDQYQYDRTIVLSNTDDQNSYKFPLYRTISPYGVYAYMIYPSGARKLIDELVYNPANTETIVNRLIEKGVLNALTYHPSIIRLNGTDATRYECRELVNQDNTLTWGKAIGYIILFIFIGLLVGLVLYLLMSNFKYLDRSEIRSEVATLPLQNEFRTTRAIPIV